MRLHPILFAIGLVACGPAEVPPPSSQAMQAAETETPPKTPRLEQVWLSEGYSSPEGVAVFDETLLISNVAGEADVKDGIGWISRVSKDGKILEEKWVEGLDAPKGMAIHNDILFVADIDTIHTIDAKTGELLNSFGIDGAGFLNDMTVWNDTVYASDSANASIHQVDENGSGLWITDPILGGVNGLLGRGDQLLVSTMNEGLLLSVDADLGLSQLAAGMTDADGIAAFDDGSYVVSSWPGRIWYVSPEGTSTSMLNTETDKTYQNDLTLVDDLIIVPNWEPGTVTAWRVIWD